MIDFFQILSAFFFGFGVFGIIQIVSRLRYVRKHRDDLWADEMIVWMQSMNEKTTSRPLPYKVEITPTGTKLTAEASGINHTTKGAKNEQRQD